MKALMLREYRHLEVQDVPQPEFGAREILIGVRACGICGSDVHGFDGSSGRRIPPLIMGHEASGVVADVGLEVTRWKKGDRVTFDSTVSCSDCDFCREGKINLCENRRVLGVSCGDYRQHGAFAEYVVVPEHIVYGLPDELSFDQAAMIEAVSVAVHAVNRSPLQLGDTAVVVGSGMIGLLVIQALRNAGCGNIIAVDLEEKKLELAKELGADFGFNPEECDVVEEVQKLTEGKGAHLAVEVVGATSTVQLAIASVRKGGSVTLVGNLAPEVTVPLQSVVTREISLFGTCASNGEYKACIDLMSRGAIRVEPLISAYCSLEEASGYFDRLYDGEEGLMKVIVQPNG